MQTLCQAVKRKALLKISYFNRNIYLFQTILAVLTVMSAEITAIDSFCYIKENIV